MLGGWVCNSPSRPLVERIATIDTKVSDHLEIALDGQSQKSSVASGFYGMVGCYIPIQSSSEILFLISLIRSHFVASISESNSRILRVRRRGTAIRPGYAVVTICNYILHDFLLL